MPISTALSRKGIRHPHCRNALLLSPMLTFTPRNVRLVSTAARPPPSRVNMPYRPRWSSGAYSALSNTDPAHSPPAANPWTSRNTIRMIGAAMPMVAVRGTRPTLTVATAIISSVAIRVFLRPSRSPR